MKKQFLSAIAVFLIWSDPSLVQASDSIYEVLQNLKLQGPEFLLRKDRADPKVLRQAKMSFAVTKSHIEKDALGKFQLKQETVCDRSFLLNVIDSSVSDPEFYFASEDCRGSLDDKEGLATFEATIMLGASLDENPAKKEKSYTPIAILKVNGRSILMTTIIESKTDDLHQVYFNLPEGNQDFYQSQQMVVGAKLVDK